MAKERLTARFYQGSYGWHWELIDSGGEMLVQSHRSSETKEGAWSNLKEILNVQRLDIEGYEEVA